MIGRTHDTRKLLRDCDYAEREREREREEKTEETELEKDTSRPTRHESIDLIDQHKRQFSSLSFSHLRRCHDQNLF